MTRKQIIIYVAVGLIATLIVGCFILIPKLNGENSNEGGGNTTDTNTSIQIPGDTSVSTDTTDDSTITPPAIGDDQYGNETDTTNDGIPKVEGGTKEEVKDKTPTVNDNQNNDKVVNGEKDKNTATEKEEDKPIIEEDEKTSTEGGEKGDVSVRDEDENVDDSNKNGPTYNPSIGGDNPFDNSIKTEIDDKPVEDYIGEGEDRPGEGMHF